MNLPAGMTHSHVRMESQGAMLHMLGGNSPNFAHQVMLALRNRFVKLVATLRPAVSVEIGAHDGHYSRLLREEFNSLGAPIRIIAIEANPVVYDKYKGIMEVADIDYRNVAVSGHEGTLTFKVPITRDGTASTHMGSLLDFPHSRERLEYEVRCVPMSNFVSDSPFVLWVDVEGANREVFTGVENLLPKCLAILVEVEDMTLWPGQMLATEFIRLSEENGFVAILRDNQKFWQYNMVLVRKDLQFDPRVEACCRNFFSDVTVAAEKERRAVKPQ